MTVVASVFKMRTWLGINDLSAITSKIEPACSNFRNIAPYAFREQSRVK